MDAGGSAELVFRGGTIRTLASDGREASALAVRNGRIVGLGNDADMLDFLGPGTSVVELAGRAVIPGINDSHLHAAWLGAMWPRTLLGSGDGMPPTVAVESPEERRSCILRAGELIAGLGITSYTEPGLGPGEDDGPTGCFGSDVLEQYRLLDAEGRLTARVNVLLLFGLLDGASEMSDYAAGLERSVAATPRPDWLRIAGVKIFADGIPPMNSAWTHRHYPDGSHGGLLVGGHDDAEREANMTGMIRMAHDAGFQVGVHATGERSIEAAVGAVRAAMLDRPLDLRHYIIHGDLVTPSLLESMARQGMGLNVQPGIAIGTSSWLAGVLGDDVAASAWPLDAAIDAGVNVCFSSDAPVLGPDWRFGMAAADEWMGRIPDPRLRMPGLLRAYTVTPAIQDGAERWKGTLEPGKFADLCVLGADPFQLEPAEMPEVPVEMTVVDGKVVFERDQSSS